MVGSKQVKLFQIFYDGETAAQIQPGFEPLNNTDGPADFFEIYPIFKYLKTNEIHDHDWLGFFSPKFQEKTSLTAMDVIQEIQETNDQVEVCSFTSHWADIAFFQNVWEHGEYCHPGLAEFSQELADRSEYEIDLRGSISCLQNSVYSHYLVAKGRFWKEWYRIVEKYFEMITGDDTLFNLKTMHANKHVSMHPFIIERVPSLILQNKSFRLKLCEKVTATRKSFMDGIFNPSSSWGEMMIQNFPDQLILADELKAAFANTGDKNFFDEYWRFRLWAPVMSGRINLTESAMRYISENCVHATMNGVVMRGEAA